MDLGYSWVITKNVYVPDDRQFQTVQVFGATINKPFHPVDMIKLLNPGTPDHIGWRVHDTAWPMSEVGLLCSIDALLARAVNPTLNDSFDACELSAYKVDGNKGLLVRAEYDAALQMQGIHSSTPRVSAFTRSDGW